MIDPDLTRSLSDLEAEPPIAAALFGDGLDSARSYTAELAERGEELGLIGPLEVPRLWTRHVINSVLLAPLLRGRVGDVGSGAGLPGIPLAIARPDLEFVLIDPMERRVDWLESEIKRLGLGNVSVIRGRAEEIVTDPLLDQVVARAVSALRTLIPHTVDLVRSGGELLFLKGASVEAEITAAAKAIRKARLSGVEVLELGRDVGTEATRVFRATVD